jgi:hypothetical protein
MQAVKNKGSWEWLVPAKSYHPSHERIMLSRAISWLVEGMGSRSVVVSESRV